MSTGSGQFHNRQPPSYSPLALASEVLAQGSTLQVGGFASPSPRRLKNPNKTAMLIDKFVFGFGTDSQTNNPPQTAQLQAKIMLGAIPFTNNFVPILNLCPTYNSPAVSGTNSLDRNACMTWHLPRPVYCPPNVQVSSQFAWQPLSPVGTSILGSTFPGPFWFAVIGRSLPTDFPIPEEIYVPWATHTRCDSRSISTYTSQNKDLSNPFPQPLRVTRFIGHAPFITTSGTTPTFVSCVQQNPLTVRMTLSSSKILVQTETPFYNLFTPSRRNMDVDGILQANEYVKATVRAPNGFVTPESGTHAQLLDLSIGMIGYRVLKTPQGSWT